MHVVLMHYGYPVLHLFIKVSAWKCLFIKEPSQRDRERHTKTRWGRMSKEDISVPMEMKAGKSFCNAGQDVGKRKRCEFLWC